MKSKIVLLFTFITNALFAQDYTQQWNEHFSYLSITGISTKQNLILASSKNALFQYNLGTEDTKNTTTLNGLTGEKISYFHYSEVYSLSVIGYENGLLEIVNEDNETTTVVDIINKPNIPVTQKKINHIYEFNDVVYLSCDYGISVFNLENLEFGDTYFIGATGNQLEVKQTTIIGSNLYAATATEGIKITQHANPNIIDFSLWTTITTPGLTNWLSVVNFNDTLYAINNNSQIYSYDGSVFSSLLTYGLAQNIKDHRIRENKMLITTADNVYLYDFPFTNTITIPYITNYNSKFTVATILNNDLFIGTENDGLLQFSVTNGTLKNNIKPNGPSENDIFSVTAHNSKVWAVYGAHTLYFNPYPLNSKGFSLLHNNLWNNTPYSDVFNAKTLVFTAINPFNENQVFISSFFSGLLEVEDNTTSLLHNNTNSALETLGPFLSPPNPGYIDIRIGQSTFDKDGILWLTNAKIDAPLKSYDPQNDVWESFSFSSIITNPAQDENGFSDIAIDQNNNKWIGSAKHGLIGVSMNNGTTVVKNINRLDGLPDDYVTTIAIDKDNNLWIGSVLGLRVLYNTSNFFTTANPQAESIIILDNGIPKELLFGQQITDIEVDGANNKWVGTADTGVFCLSPNGQKTIYHFTKDNSPIPSDIISDISIDSITGEVYFATPNGMVSFNSNITAGNEDLDNVYAFPNPVKPEHVKNNPDLKVTISGLKKDDKSNVKITDISGNLVFETTTSGGGTVEWDLSAFGKYKVASGVYLIMVTTADGSESTIEKIMVIR